MKWGRTFSAHSDFKTGFTCKFFFLIAILLLLFYIIESFIHVLNFNPNTLGTILAFSILCFGIAGFSYFFFCQFSKLSKIAEEIENEEPYEEKDD